MSNLNPNLPTAEMARLLTAAGGKMATYQKRLLTPQLLLLAMLEDKQSGAYQILSQLAQQKGVNLPALQTTAETMAKFSDGRDAHFNFTDDFGKAVPLADEILILLDEGLSIAQSREELKVGSGHVLAIMATTKVTTGGALQKAGVNQTAVVGLLDAITQEGAAAILTDYVQLAQKGEALPYYQREALLRDLRGLLALAGRPNVLLVGPSGSGKRTVVYNLAQLVAEGKGGDIRSVVELNEMALLEDPLKALRAGLRRASGGVLLVPHIERFFGGRLQAKFPEQVCRDLHKAILGSEQSIIGTASTGAFAQLQQEELIRQQMPRLEVPPATKDEAVAMLQFHKPRLEADYKLTVTREALETAVSLASQYIQNVALPASAVQLADRACALVSLIQQEQIPTEQGASKTDGQVDGEDVMVAASQMTKIPISKLGADEQGRYANMVGHIQERLIGQEEAVMAVSRAVKIARVGLRSPKRPIGSFLFLGPSGVGKSELAKALAEFMFGSESKMLTLDMSEYQEEASVNRLIGPPPGYVGFQGGGQLTNFVRDNPYTVVLFDEVEKANDKVFDVLLQLLDEGRLTDGQGRPTNFSETVVIMTSNLGARHMLTPAIGEYERELVMAEVHKFFRPEFLNRVDDIVLFHQLTAEQLAQIFDLLLKQEAKLAAQQGLELVVSPKAKTWILAQNTQPEFGARPLRRLIDRHLREPLADHLLKAGASAQGTVVMVDGNDAGLLFEVVAGK